MVCKKLIIFVFVAIISLAAYDKEVYLTVPPATFNSNTVNNLKTVKMSKEIWKDVSGYEGIYQVSDLGNVKSLERYVNSKCGSIRIVRERILKPGVDSRGYLNVVLSKNGKAKTRTVHQLECESFKGFKQNGFVMVINHKNFIRTDNRLKNLEIVTMRENTNQKHLKSSSKYTGVSWHKRAKKWTSQIWNNDKLKHLGYFTDEHEASLAYQKALNQYINF